MAGYCTCFHMYAEKIIPLAKNANTSGLFLHMNHQSKLGDHTFKIFLPKPILSKSGTSQSYVCKSRMVLLADIFISVLKWFYSHSVTVPNSRNNRSVNNYNVDEYFLFMNAPYVDKDIQLYLKKWNIFTKIYCHRKVVTSYLLLNADTDANGWKQNQQNSITMTTLFSILAVNIEIFY